jgi:hypothetical protein
VPQVQVQLHVQLQLLFVVLFVLQVQVFIIHSGRVEKTMFME